LLYHGFLLISIKEITVFLDKYGIIRVFNFWDPIKKQMTIGMKKIKDFFINIIREYWKKLYRKRDN